MVMMLLLSAFGFRQETAEQVGNNVLRASTGKSHVTTVGPLRLATFRPTLSKYYTIDAWTNSAREDQAAKRQ